MSPPKIYSGRRKKKQNKYFVNYSESTNNMDFHRSILGESVVNTCKIK